MTNEVIGIQLTSKPFEFSQFQKPENNLITTQEWLKTAKEVHRFPYVTLYKYLQVEPGIAEWYIAVDSKGLTQYAVRVEDVKALPLRAACQVGVWRNPQAATTKIAASVFWDVLFLQHDMISDKVQTEHGQRFWSYRIAEAFDKNLCVYFLKLRESKIVEILRMKSLDDFVDRAPLIWGADLKMQKVRLAITKNPIHFT